MPRKHLQFAVWGHLLFCLGTFAFTVWGHLVFCLGVFAFAVWGHLQFAVWGHLLHRGTHGTTFRFNATFSDVRKNYLVR